MLVVPGIIWGGDDDEDEDEDVEDEEENSDDESSDFSDNENFLVDNLGFGGLPGDNNGLGGIQDVFCCIQ